ncbi:S-layer protein domain-containing protein [Methanolobus sp. WCC4]|uniref:S-layer protein domain-containing protein n=1 Tax=Methanolobus sp. WCC4 TaxID=3125784 RepID=UPI0030F582F0
MPEPEGICKIIIASLILFSIITPALAEPSIIGTYNEHLVVREEKTVLINGTGIFLTTGDSWDLYQGYILSIKSVNLENKQAWLELLLNDELLKEGFLSEGDTFVYSKGEDEIINITLDTIYISPEGELVTFKPAYQYQDRDLPEPVIEEEEESNIQENSSTSTENDTIRQSSGFTILHTFAGMSILLLYRRVFAK